MIKRNAWLTALLSLCLMGWGHLYVGRADRFFAALLALVIFWVVLAFGGLPSTFIGHSIGCIGAIVFAVFSVIDPIQIARKSAQHRRWYMKWYCYVLYFFLVTFTFAIFHIFVAPSGTGIPKLGFETYRSLSDDMAPTVLEKECVLVDTWAYRTQAPSVGDLVVVRTPDMKRRYLRRITMVSDGMVLVASDKFQTTSASEDYANNVEIPMTRIEGKATYISVSSNLSRLGKKISALDRPRPSLLQPSIPLQPSIQYQTE
ncbi:MAG: S26 family signal peptidase [Pseudomonadota bacterium]|nr:S26 family signal peptidase [Pseudomonadota bacterium]